MFEGILAAVSKVMHVGWVGPILKKQNHIAVTEEMVAKIRTH